MKAALKFPINLASENLPLLSVPNDYSQYEMPSFEEGYFVGIRNFITPFAESCEEKGYGGNIFTALYEAVLNAYTHGNKRDKNKKVLLGSKIGDSSLEFIIADQGKSLHPDFMRFVLAHRERTDQRSNFINWYEFADTDKKNEYNNGTGTFYSCLHG